MFQHFILLYLFYSIFKSELRFLFFYDFFFINYLFYILININIY